MVFTEAIAVQLALTIGSKKTVIPGAHVERFSLDLARYGFTGEVTFASPALYRDQDDLVDRFKGLDAATVELAIAAQHNMPDEPPDPLTVHGLVTRKSVTETAYGQVSGTVSYFRRYRIEFSDLAQVVWPQHFPCVLMTDTTLQDVIDVNKPAGMSLSYDWNALSRKYDMICLPLDVDTSDASFYDFLLWYVRTHNGVLTYNGAKDQYSLTDAKPLVLTAANLDPDELAALRVNVPETIRHDAAVINAVAENSAIESITQDQSIAGIRHDGVIRTYVPADLDGRVARDKLRLSARGATLELEFKSFPTVSIQPDKGISLSQSERLTQHSSLASARYRVFAVSIRGAAVEREPSARDGASDRFDVDVEQAYTAYDTQLTVRLEPTSETHVELPEFRRPEWPIQVEGKIVSVGGDTGDKTYYIYEDSTTSLPMYNVDIPLWNKQVSAPYRPLGMPGHYHFPAFRDQRVLVGLHFLHAAIDRFLDHGARTQLTMDTQGNHILFGQNDTSETSMRYAYEDGDSLFEVLRVMDGDHVTWQMKQGLLYLEVREDESAATTETTYDVQVEVEAGKNELESAVSGAIGEVTGKFNTGTAEISGAIGAATADVNTALTDMDATISGAIADTRSQIDSAASGLSAGASQLSSAASSASSDLRSKAQG